MRRVVEAVAHLARPAWVPVPSRGAAARRGSKLGGSALLPPGEPWPRCPGCLKLMPLFCQLDLATIPPEVVGGDGLLQLFGCVTPDYEAPQADECAHSNRYNGARAHIVNPRLLVAPDERPDNELPEVGIATWARALDYPIYEEAEATGVELPDELLDEYWECRDIPLGCTKLGGWPAWTQGATYEPCPTCGESMSVVLQLQSPQFGEVGLLQQCLAHPHRFFYEECI